VKAVKAQLILDIKENQQAAGDTNGKAGYIDDGKALLLEHVSQKDLEVIAEHCSYPAKLGKLEQPRYRCPKSRRPPKL
jgi:hypothetical protein